MIERVQKIYPSTLELVDKINEIVYNVNVLQMHEERRLDLLTELNCCIQQARKKPADPYAEQRKWVGKLCKFDGKHYGILKRISNSDTIHVWKDGPFGSSDGFWYDSCELVKPDDDLIYKGDNNE